MRIAESPSSGLVGNLLRLGTFTSILVSMSGCSTANIAASVAPPPGGPSSGTEPKYATVTPRPAANNRSRKYVSRHKSAKPPQGIEPDKLLGLSPQEVLHRLGPPAHTKSGRLSREWVYATADCRFRIFFYPEVDLTSFRALKYRSVTDGGGEIDDSRICVRQILAARSANEH